MGRIRTVATALVAIATATATLVATHVAPATAASGGAAFSMACVDAASGSPGSFLASASGAASPDPVAVSQPVTLTGTTFQLDQLASSLALAGYRLGLLPRTGTLPTTSTVTITGSATVEGTQTLTSSSSTSYAITDPDGNPSSGDETVTSAMVQSLPDSTWTGTGGTIGFAVTAETFTIQVVPGLITVTGTCQPGTVTGVPGSQIVVSDPPTPFTSVSVSSTPSVTFHLACSDSAGGNPGVMTTTASGTANPNPAAALQPIALTNTTVGLNGLGAPLALAGYALGLLPPGGSMPTTASVTIAGSATGEGTQTITTSGVNSFTISDPTPLNRTSGDEVASTSLQLALPDTTWTGTGGTIELAVTALTFTLQVVPGLISVNGTCQPGTVAFGPTGGVVVPEPPTAFATVGVDGTVAPPGGTVSTDLSVNVAHPLSAAVTTPTGGVVMIEELVGTPGQPTPSGYALVGDHYLVITAPAATAADPLVLRFVIDATLLDGLTPDQVTVLRDGVPAAPCLVAGDVGTATPDPCVGSRTTLANGDLAIVVRTSHASEWSIAALLNRPPAATAGGPYEVPEGSGVTLAATASDPDGDGLTYHWTPTPAFGALSSADVLQPTYTGRDDGIDTVVLRATDPGNLHADAPAVVTVRNVAPRITALTPSTAGPVALGSSAGIGATWADPGAADTFGVSFDWGDGTTTAAAGLAVGTSSLARSHTYAAPGVYEVGVTVRDDDGGTGNATYQYLVVFDPSGAFVTGGGWFTSPSGAYGPNPSAEGKATFGFVSKYKKGTSIPTGNTEFQLQSAGFELSSTSYDWLVVAGSKAKFKGVATVNGVPGYGFMLTAVDGPGGTGGADAIRVKVWSLLNGSVVYDNRAGSDDAGYDTTALGGGSIIVHK